MAAHIRQNTSKEYPCLRCGYLGNIIRESDVDEERRIKCNRSTCGFVYSAADSLAAKEAGRVPNGPPQVSTETPKEVERSSPSGDSSEKLPESKEDARPPRNLAIAAPRGPSFVILSKDRLNAEFCTKRSLKGKVILWTAQGLKFDVYQLSPKKVQATLSIE